MRNGRTWTGVVPALTLIAALSGPLAHAGPPLVCWQVDTGGAASLPWTSNPHSYEGIVKAYDTARLGDDTLALLGPEAPVLARMETLRRASIYASKDRAVAQSLLTRLVSRAKEGPGDALALFDAGYFVEALHQANGANEPEIWTKLLEGVGLREKSSRGLGGLSGYQYVEKALEMRGDDPEMEYGAALITWYPRQASHEGHFRKAAAGATEDSLLEKNLLRHFSDRGRTIAELRASHPTAQ